MHFCHDDDELTMLSYYPVRVYTIERGSILAEQNAGAWHHLRFIRYLNLSVQPPTSGTSASPSRELFPEAACPSVIGLSDPSNVTHLSGAIVIDQAGRKIAGSNPEPQQDIIISPSRSEGLGRYSVARSDTPFGTT